MKKSTIQLHRPICLTEQDVKREEDTRALLKREAAVFLWMSVIISIVVLAAMLAVEIAFPSGSDVLVGVVNG